MLFSAPGPGHDARVSQPDLPDPDQPPRVLVIDDDRKLCRLIADYLDPLGYRVSYVHSGPEGVARATQEAWGAVILDLMLPGLDGFEVLKRIRAASDVPVLMLTARGDEADRIVGLEIGADDYLPKTFSTRELLARLRAVMRRARATGTAAENKAAGSDSRPSADPPKTISIGELTVCPDDRTASLAGAPLALTPVEFDLLVSLARSRGRVKSREQLLEEIRDRDYDVFDRSVDVHVSALRKKLGDDPRQPRFIRTLRSAGYLMIDPRRER
jgi:two-component system response regulator CpxR